MKKFETLKIVGWLGLVMMVLASWNDNTFAPYLSQGLFLGAVLLHAYKKWSIRMLVIIVSVLLFVIRLVGFTSGYDFIDMALWGAIIYLVW
jgi:hypothetical protein